MKANPDHLTIKEVLDLKAQQMLIVNPEYQRGAVWTSGQKKRLVDSVLRGYPIPLIYFHLIVQVAGKLKSERFEVIDGQQRINALSDYADGAFKLFDPIKDAAEARFPDFLKKQPCPWGGKKFLELSEELRQKFQDTALPVVQIETHDANEARDLFVRLQAGMPLNSQEKRDAWPGQFTDFILTLGGKPGIARYPGHDFFNELMGSKRTSDRGKNRQLAAQIAILFLHRHKDPTRSFRDINAVAIDDFYYENLGFDADSEDARRLTQVLDKLAILFRDHKRSKIAGHEAIHLVLTVDTLLDDYAPAWEDNFAAAFDEFRKEFVLGKKSRNDSPPSESWIRYGQHTRVNSDRGDNIRRRQDFFASKMRENLNVRLKDPARLFGDLDRDLIYYRDKKRCAACEGEVRWSDAEFHHVEEHSKGGATSLNNGALVHNRCHPKGAKQTEAFAEKWRKRQDQQRETTKKLDALN